MRSLLPSGCLALLLFAGVLLLPFFLADVMLTALGRLGLGPGTSVAAAFAIFVGGMVNIPVRRLQVERRPNGAIPHLFGLGRGFFPQPPRREELVIAVNVGGCVVPAGLAAYQLTLMAGQGSTVLGAGLLAIASNTAICYWVARPIENVGIAMPPLVPALVAAVSALLMTPDFAPPVAFSAGVLGPLIGADLLHIDDIKEISTGAASIGGAGTFDGIVLSGLVATLLA